MASAHYFINPYNFVRYDPNIDRIRQQRNISVAGHDRYSGYSGRFTCELTTLTPILVAGKQDRVNNYIYFFKTGSTTAQFPAIPGSSIKGMLRNVVEAISSSCFSMLGDTYELKSNYGRNANQQGLYTSSTSLIYQVRRKGSRFLFSFINLNNLLPSEYWKDNCKLTQNGTGLCLGCRLFGSTTDDKSALSFAGKVIIKDALIGYKESNNGFHKHTTSSFHSTKSQIIRKAYKGQHTLSSPKVYHEPFYVDTGGIKGRKFYHHNNRILLPEDGEVELELVNTNVVFQFTVEYHNLSQIELGLLCLALQLEWDEQNHDMIAHKIGMGKPVGLGSARIEIVKIEEIPDPENRYKSIGTISVISDPDQIQNRVQGWIQQLKANNQVSFYPQGWEDLKNILRYPHPQHPNHNDPVEYPDRNWFNVNGSVPLPTPEEVASRVSSKMLKK